MKPGTVANIREATKGKTDFYTPEELLKHHPESDEDRPPKADTR